MWLDEIPAKRRRMVSLSVAALVGAATTRFGLPKPAQAATAADASADTALGIALEGYPYPGPVHFLPVHAGAGPVRMAYMDFAPTIAANDRTVFLLHGKNFDSSYWAGPIEWLRGAGYRVVVPDQIGFNKSAKPDTEYTFEMLAANTMALADSLGLNRITVFGHSTGGMLAVRLTSIFPDRVDKLVLEDPIGLVDYRAFIEPQATETLVAAERNYTAQTYRDFIAHYFPILPPAQYEPFVTWRMRIALSAEFERFALASALTYQMIYRGPVVDLYDTLKPPVLLVAGEADQSAPLSGYATPDQRARMPRIPDAAKTMVSCIPRGRLVTYPSVGHVPHLEVAARFRGDLLGFLNGA
jgi:pimeloyl-ACP methyl ester carboxylesterase